VRAIIHIGGEKTGTSTIQTFCAKNRLALAAQGILYPTSPGASNHLKLTAYALEDDAVDDTRQSLALSTREQIDEFRKQLRADLSREIAKADDASTLILSNEHLQSRLLKGSEVRRLANLVRNYTDDITILLYIRRQDRVAVSHYSTRLKSDSFTDDIVFPTPPGNDLLPEYYDYAAVLTRYEKVFGQENIVVRLFDANRFVDGDLLQDFRHACDIPGSAALAAVGRENESLSETGIRFFKRFNPQVPRFVNGRVNPYRHGVAAAITSRYAGAGPVASGAEAKTFYQSFATSNRAVRDRYFPDLDGPLFDEDFTHYDREQAAAIPEDDLIDLAIHLWVDRATALEALRIENALLRFQLAVRDDPARAPPTPPDVSLDGALPTPLMLRYLGALLYIRSFRKVADITAVLLAARTTGPVMLFVHACALAGLGERTGLEPPQQNRALSPKMRRSLETIALAGLDRQPISRWMEFFKNETMAHTQVYSRCLAWLDR
jgi:hypothetical protein